MNSNLKNAVFMKQFLFYIGLISIMCIINVCFILFTPALPHFEKKEWITTLFLFTTGSLLTGIWVSFLAARRIHFIISDREKELEAKNNALKAQTLQALEASKLKSEFVASMSHELRTPLNSIIGFTSRVIKKSADHLDPIQLENLIIVKDQAYHLLQLINGLLDYSKLEAGKMNISLDQFDLKDIVSEITPMVKMLIENKPLKYSVNLPSNCHLPLYNDRLKIKQILINLLSNAVKYSEKGEIKLSVISDSSFYKFHIADEGIGIASEHLNHIFNEFYQVDGSYTRKIGGTGLGLSITKSFIEMLGGTIEVESTLGVGTTFSFTIPVNYSPLSNPISSTDKLKVVCIEDDPITRRLYKQYLSEHNIDLIGLSGMENVVEKIKEIMPSAILLDIMLPNKDGWEILSLLKNSYETKQIPVIMISVLNEKELAFKLYADDYLIKPITQDELIESIMHILPHRRV